MRTPRQAADAPFFKGCMVMDVILVVGELLILLWICLPRVEWLPDGNDTPVSAALGTTSLPIGEVGPLEIHPVRARCKVCGSGMTSRIVFCSRCRTAHHEECWTYGGGCSIYACGASRPTHAPGPKVKLSCREYAAVAARD